MTVSEKVLWDFLRKERTGFRFRKQVPVLDFILDFYCAEAKVCIEVDGEQHLEQQDYDRYRDRVLGEAGILTMRVPSLDLFDASDKLGPWINEINRTCCERTGKVPQRIF